MAWEPDYVSVDDLENYVRIPDDVDAAWVALSISAASRAIDHACNRQFGKVDAPVARYYTPRLDRARGRWVVEIDDLMTAAGLVVSVDVDDTGDYSGVVDAMAMKPVNAQPDGMPWTELVVLPNSTNMPRAREDSVEVLAAWGWTAVPNSIEQACLLQASRFLTRRNAPFGIAGSPADGSEIRLLAKLDPDVAVMIQKYVRWWGAR